MCSGRVDLKIPQVQSYSRKDIQYNNQKKKEQRLSRQHYTENVISMYHIHECSIEFLKRCLSYYHVYTLGFIWSERYLLQLIYLSVELSVPDQGQSSNALQTLNSCFFSMYTKQLLMHVNVYKLPQLIRKLFVFGIKQSQKTLFIHYINIYI